MLLLLPVLAFVSATAFADAAPARWTPSGARWAIARSANGAALAIHDLSYPDFAGGVPMGTLGERGTGLGVVRDILREAGTLADRDGDDAELEQALADLDSVKDRDLVEGTLPASWWRNSIWKNAMMTMSGVAPDSFTLAEFDLPSLIKPKDRAKYEKLRKEIADAVAADDEQLLGADPLAQFRLTRIPAGGYQVAFEPAVRARVAGVAGKRLLNLENKKEGLLQAIVREAYGRAMGKLIGLIPHPVVRAVISTTFDRFQHFNHLVLRTHQDALVEAIRATEDVGAPAGGPLAALTPAELATAKEAMVFAQTSLLSSWKWAFRSPASDWTKSAAKEVDYGHRSSDWLTRHQPGTIALTPRFALDSLTRPQLAFSLGQAKPSSSNGPKVAFNLARGDAIRNRRIWVEVAAVAVKFATEFVPVVGGAVNSVFTNRFMNPQDQGRRWESRLTSRLEMLPADSIWDAPIAALDRQRVNPFENSRATMFRLILERRASLGL